MSEEVSFSTPTTKTGVMTPKTNQTTNELFGGRSQSPKKATPAQQSTRSDEEQRMLSMFETINQISKQLSNLTLATQTQSDMISRVSLETRVLTQKQDSALSRICDLENKPGRSSKGSNDDQTEVISNALARALIQDREAKRNQEEADKQQREMIEEIKVRNALIQHAPKYDGGAPLDPWLARIKRYFLTNNVKTEDQINVAIWVLEGEASHFLGDLPEEDYPTDLEELAILLQERFGKSLHQRLDEFESLRQRPDQSARRYADQIRKRAYGTGRSEQEQIRKMLTTLADKSIYPLLAARDFMSLREATDAVERTSRALIRQKGIPSTKPRTSYGTKSNTDRKCHQCGKTGHLQKDCPKRKQPTSREAKVNEAEVSEDENEANVGGWEDVDPDDKLDLEEHEVGWAEAQDDAFDDELQLEGYTICLEAMPAEKRRLEDEKALEHSREVKAKLEPRKYTPAKASTSTTNASNRAVKDEKIRLSVPAKLPEMPTKGYSKEGTTKDKYKANSHLTKVMESSIGIPADLCFGLMLNASKDPVALAKATKNKARKQLEEMAKNWEVGGVEIIANEANVQRNTNWQSNEEPLNCQRPLTPSRKEEHA